MVSKGGIFESWGRTLFHKFPHRVDRLNVISSLQSYNGIIADHHGEAEVAPSPTLEVPDAELKTRNILKTSTSFVSPRSEDQVCVSHERVSSM